MRSCVLSIALAVVVTTSVARADDFATFVARTAAANLKATGAASVSVGVMRGGRIVLTRAFGRSRLQPNVRATDTTTYNVGSITKQFTAAAILMLAQEQKLSLGDPIAKYVPTAFSGANVTISELLNQTAGYVDYYPLDYVDNEMQKPTTADAIIAEYATRPLDFEPGTKYSYSNTNYTLLGKVIEVASGEPLERFLSERIFTPLGMTHTRCVESAEGDLERAYGYTTLFLNPLSRATPESPGWLGAAGCITSTPSDLLKWDAALTSGRVLTAASLSAMTAQTRLKNGGTSNYGYGIVAETLRGHRVFFHDGGTSGFSAFNIMLPDDGDAVVLLYNTDNVDMASLYTPILRNLLNISASSSHPAAAPQPTMSPKDAEGATMVRTLMLMLQEDNIDRTLLTADFNAFLTPDLERQASVNLAKLGSPLNVVANVSENHGQEFTTATVQFSSRAVNVTMRRTSDGKVAEFLVSPG